MDVEVDSGKITTVERLAVSSTKGTAAVLCAVLVTMLVGAEVAAVATIVVAELGVSSMLGIMRLGYDWFGKIAFWEREGRSAGRGCCCLWSDEGAIMNGSGENA
jgi:hypothetical protein